MSGPNDDMGSLLKQAQKMQRELDLAREELEELRVEGTAAGGLVTVLVTGSGLVRSVKIAPEALDQGGLTGVEEWVQAAVTDGLQRAKILREERLSKVTGGLNLPGLL
jgi:DNA-binding YbaB/EbfC family protein